MEYSTRPLALPPANHPCLISTDLGKRAPRSIGLPPYPPVIVRSDRAAAVKDFASRCKQKYPDTCRYVYPGCQTKDLFDDYDIHVEEGKFLDEVIRYLAAENIEQVHIFCYKWSEANRDRVLEVAQIWHDNPANPLEIVDACGLFQHEDIHIYGREFLWHALNEMKASLIKVAESQAAARLKQEQEADRTPNQVPAAAAPASSYPPQQDPQLRGGHLSDSAPLAHADHVPSQLAYQKRGKGGELPRAPMRQQPANPDVRRILSAEQPMPSDTTASMRSEINVQRPITTPQQPGAMSLPHTPTFRTAFLNAPPGAATQLSHPPNAHTRQHSGGNAENMGPRGPVSHHRVRQTSSGVPNAAQSPRYPHPVEAVKMQGQSLRPTPSQNHPSMAISPSYATHGLYGAAQFYQAAPMGLQVHPSSQMMMNPNMMPGIPYDAMPVGPHGQIVYQIADATNVQPPNSSLVPINTNQAYYQQGATVVQAVHTKQPQLFDPYGDANPGFAQMPRGKGKGKNSFSGNPNKGRKFSSGSYSRGGQGQYTGDGGYQQNANYPGTVPYGANQPGGNLQNQTQQVFRGPRNQESQGHSGQWSANHGSRHPSGSGPQAMEPFPAFENQQQQFQAPTFSGQRMPPSQPSKSRHSDSRPSFGSNPADGVSSQGYGGRMGPNCGEDWIGPDAMHIRQVWVHGFQVHDNAAAGLAKWFEEKVGSSVVRVDMRTDKNSTNYAYVHFNTRNDAEKALSLNAKIYENRPLYIKVPLKFYEPDTRPFQQEAGSGHNKSRRTSNAYSTSGFNPAFQGRPYGFSSPKIERPQRQSSQDPTPNKKPGKHGGQPSVTPTYSPQDARSDLNRQPSQENFAGRGSPEMKKGKKSARTSPKKLKQEEVGDMLGRASQTQSSSPVEDGKVKSEVTAREPSVAPSQATSLLDSDSPPQTSATAPDNIADTELKVETASADAQSSAAFDDTKAATESTDGSDASTVVAVAKYKDSGANDTNEEATYSQISPDVVEEAAEQVPESTTQTPASLPVAPPSVSISQEQGSEPCTVVSSDVDQFVETPSIGEETTEPTSEESANDQRKEVGPSDINVGTANQSRLLIPDDNTGPQTPNDFRTAPQTPMEAFHRPASPETAVPSKEDLVSDDEEQKHDSSFVSAKESQSDGEPEAQRGQVQTDDQASTLDNVEARTSHELEGEATASKLEEQPTCRNRSVEAHPATEESAASSKPPARTESLHPFAKVNKRKENSKKKTTKKKGKGKEAQQPKAKGVETSRLSDTANSEPTLEKTEAVPEDNTKPSTTTKAKEHNRSDSQNQSTTEGSSSADAVEDIDDQTQEAVITKTPAPESPSKVGIEPAPSPTNLSIPPASSSPFQQKATKASGAVLSYEPVLPAATAILQGLDREMTEAEKVKEKKRRAIAAKVAIPNLNLVLVARRPQSTGKSVTPEPHSPVRQNARRDSVLPRVEEVKHVAATKETSTSENVLEGAVSEMLTDIKESKTLDESATSAKPSALNIVAPESSEVESSKKQTQAGLTTEVPTEDTAAVSKNQPPKGKKSKKKKKKTEKNLSLSTVTSQNDTAPTTDPPVETGGEFSEQFKEIAEVLASRKSLPSYYSREHIDHSTGRRISISSAAQPAGIGETSPFRADQQLYPSQVSLTAEQLEEIQRSGDVDHPPSSVIGELYNLHSNKTENEGASASRDPQDGSKASGKKPKGG